MKHGKRFLSPCTAAGHIKIKRQYRSCPACGDSLFAADKALGIEDGYTGGARQVITLAGGSWGFLQSSMMLKRFLGISVSSKTIRNSKVIKSANWSLHKIVKMLYFVPIQPVQGDNDGTKYHGKSSTLSTPMFGFARKARRATAKACRRAARFDVGTRRCSLRGEPCRIGSRYGLSRQARAAR